MSSKQQYFIIIFDEFAKPVSKSCFRLIKNGQIWTKITFLDIPEFRTVYLDQQRFFEGPILNQEWQINSSRSMTRLEPPVAEPENGKVPDTDETERSKLADLVSMRRPSKE